MGNQTLHIDIVIIGGGIAGLWTLNQLRNLGYSAVLFEQEALGGYQTIASQGIIHGGIKYALSGMPGRDSQTISSMPQRWRECLAGRGKVDLTGTRLLSDSFCLWSNADLPSRLSTFFASKLLRSRVHRLDSEAFPSPLQSPDFRGQVYRLADFVLDMPSLLEALSAPHRECIFSLDWDSASLRNTGGRALLNLPGCTVTPRCLILTAGAGNESLIKALGGSAPRMQRRPLQQVLVKHQYPHKLFAHCLGVGSSPRLTVSSHCTASGEPVWYLGGDLATAGATDPAHSLIAKARAELAELLPWVELGRTQWRTLSIDRAEPQQPRLRRPDSAFVSAVSGIDNALVAWPTKLSLSPNLGDAIERQLQEGGVLPGQQSDLSPLRGQGQPPKALPAWDTLFS